MAIIGLEAKSACGAGERVERAAHVHGIDADKDARARREGQHAASMPSSRRRVSSL